MPEGAVAKLGENVPLKRPRPAGGACDDLRDAGRSAVELCFGRDGGRDGRQAASLIPPSMASARPESKHLVRALRAHLQIKWGERFQINLDLYSQEFEWNYSSASNIPQGLGIIVPVVFLPLATKRSV